MASSKETAPALVESGLDAETRTKLVQLACIAAWSDAEIQDAERRTVLTLCSELALSPGECAQATAWLDGPPPFLDPQEIPRPHRQLFVDTLERVVQSDGRLSEDERDTLRVIRELLS
jgi:uncharacterized tellurite resistance protein B-like protein